MGGRGQQTTGQQTAPGTPLARSQKAQQQGSVSPATSSSANERLTFSFSKPPVNASSSNALRYPKKDPITSDSDYVTFTFYKYNPPWGNTSATGSTGQSGGSSTLTNPSDAYSKYNRSGIEGIIDTEMGSIVMYMPEDIQSEFGANWNHVGVGELSRFIMGGVGNPGGGLANVTDVAGNLAQFVGLGKQAGYGLLTDAINKYLGGGGISTNQVMGGISGTIINPNVEMLYESPKLRAFDLSFKMSARSNDEAKEIKKICNRFKKAMLPRFGGGALFDAVTAGNLITIPNLCQVTFMAGTDRHPVLPQYKLCAITNVSVNYTPDGSYAVFSDSNPVSTQLRVSFAETKLIFGHEINESGASF